MRNLLTPARFVLTVAFVALGLTPTLAQAAPRSHPSAIPQNPTIIGTVVATPQPPVPTSLFIQVGSQTISIAITDDTRLLRRFNSVSNLQEFTDGDTVRVTGIPNQNGGITASEIVNTSVQIANTDLQGNVVSITPAGTVPTTLVINNLNALAGSSAPFPSPLPAQMSLPISAATTIVIGGHATSASSAIGQVNVNDQVTARGVFDRFTNQFDSVSKLTDNTSTTPINQKVVGTLASAPSSLTAPSLLCLSGAVLSNNALAPQMMTATPCPSGWVAVYVTSTTTFSRHFGGTSALDELSVGDSLTVNGALINGQFTASTIEDTSIQAVNGSVSGPVQAVIPNGNVTSVTITAATNGGAQAPFPVGATVVLPLANSTAPNCTAPSATQFPCTVVTTSTGSTQGYATGEITVGQTVSADGVYNLRLQQYLYISTVNVTGSTTPPPTSQVVKGTLAAAPSQSNAQALLCLSGAVLTRAGITPHIATVSPCANGWLPVFVTSATTFTRLYGETSALFELSVGDSLTVTGTLVNLQFTASKVQDTSIHLPHLTGTIQSIAPNGNVTNVTITASANNGGGTAGAIGAQVVLPLANAGSPNCAAPSNTQAPCTVVTTSAGTTQGYNVGELAVGQTVQATGVFNDQTHQFLYISTIQAAGTTAPPPPVSTRRTISGILAANPSQVTAPVTLCLRNVHLPRHSAAPPTGVCPRGQVPVLVSSSTSIVRRYNGASNLDELTRGDHLQVNGILSNGEMAAARIKDLSIQAAFTRVVGTVGFVNPHRHPYFTLRVQSDTGGRAPFKVGSVITIYVSAHTQIINPSGTGYNVKTLNPGQTVTVLGVYDRRRHSFIDASRVRVH